MMDDQACWAAVVARDPSADGTFVFAVRTTKIYCRPTCKARRARRANVSFFKSPVGAESAGFRACKRCHPQSAVAFNCEAQRMAAVCDYLRRLPPDAPMPKLDELAVSAGLTKFHFHRLFKRELGVTPRDFMLELRREVRGSSSSSPDSPTSSGGCADSTSLILPSESIADQLPGFDIDIDWYLSVDPQNHLALEVDEL